MEPRRCWACAAEAVMEGRLWVLDRAGFPIASQWVALCQTCWGRVQAAQQHRTPAP